MGSNRTKHSRQGDNCYADVFAFFIDKSFQRFSHSSLGTEQDMPLTMEISIYTHKFLYKKAISTCFLELFLCLLFLKNNQLEIILMAKWHILVWHILCPTLKPHWGFRFCEGEQLNINMYSL